MGHAITTTSRRSGKAQSLKDAWIAETQSFQRMADIPESTYETLSQEYDKEFRKASTSRKATMPNVNQ
jgi:hypothetical protein